MRSAPPLLLYHVPSLVLPIAKKPSACFFKQSQSLLFLFLTCSANRCQRPCYSTSSLLAAPTWERERKLFLNDSLGHPFEKAHEKGMDVTSPHCFVCSEQKTGRGSSETEPEEPTERQSSRVRRWCATRRTITSCYHIYNYTEITKH